MKVKAIKSFVGVVSMNLGEEKDLQPSEVVNDLVKAGYVKVIDDKPATPKKATEKPKTEEKTEVKEKAKPKGKATTKKNKK